MIVDPYPMGFVELVQPMAQGYNCPGSVQLIESLPLPTLDPLASEFDNGI